MSSFESVCKIIYQSFAFDAQRCWNPVYDRGETPASLLVCWLVVVILVLFLIRCPFSHVLKISAGGLLQTLTNAVRGRCWTRVVNWSNVTMCPAPTTARATRGTLAVTNSVEVSVEYVWWTRTMSQRACPHDCTCNKGHTRRNEQCTGECCTRVMNQSTVTTCAAPTTARATKDTLVDNPQCTGESILDFFFTRTGW